MLAATIQLIPTGNVFEKRLVEAYISENGKDPVTGEELTTDDIVELKSARMVRPRPPTLTSIPSLLSVFQTEWDALALETYTLRQHLTQTRQELSHALYENDAARRVIARLSKERDEARDALSAITTNGPTASNSDAMHVDGPELPAALVTKVETTQERYGTILMSIDSDSNMLADANLLGSPKRGESEPYQTTGLQQIRSNPTPPIRNRNLFFQAVGTFR